MTVKTEKKGYKHGETALEGYLAYDDGIQGKRPGVLVVHCFRGLRSLVNLALKQKEFTHILYDMRYVFGNLSPFTAHEKNLLEAFQNKYLKLIKTEDRRYYLYQLIESPSQTH